MLPSSNLPDPQRRLVRSAFLTLFGILASQSLLETARDTLLVSRLPVGRLPWLYLAMAAVTLVVGRVSAGRRAGAMVGLLVGSVATAALWPVLGSNWGLYALFLWTGIFSAWTVTQVWMALSDSLDLSQAKHLYGRLAAGGGLGAVVGAVVARLSSGALEPRSLVLLAALVIAATALGPALGLGAGAAVSALPEPTQEPSDKDPPMLARLFAMTTLVALVSTLIDFSFKEAVAARLAPAQLPAFFATFHLVGTTVSLAVQLFGVALVLRLVGVGRAQLVLPLTLMAGAVAAVATGGFAALVMMRGLDTGLRNSFQRPSFELLQVPLRDELRRRAKPLIDVLGQRGGQAVAALALLVTLQLSASPAVRMLMVAALLVLWIVIAAGLNHAYVDLLRSALLGTAQSAPDMNLSAINVLTSQQNRELGSVMALLAQKRAPAEGQDSTGALIPLLAREEMRAVARASLVAAGPAALPSLKRALLDPGQPRVVRVNVIRPLAEIDPLAAAPLFADALLGERDPFVALRLARALDRLTRDRPELSLDHRLLDRAAVAAGESAGRYLAWRLALEEGAEHDPARDTATSAMLRVALHEQEETAVELLFHVLALRDPQEDFRRLLLALRAGPRRTRAAARELVGNLLTGAARATTLALMQPGDRARLTALGRPPEQLEYRALLAALATEGGSIARLAVHHADELGGPVSSRPPAPAVWAAA
jgi:ATP/ADP translocase